MLLLYAIATKKNLSECISQKIIVFYWLFLYEHPSNTFDCTFCCFYKDWKITKFLCGFNSSYFEHGCFFKGSRFAIAICFSIKLFTTSLHRPKLVTLPKGIISLWMVSLS